MSKQEEKIAKIKKSCKTTKTVINVVKVILIVAFILCVTGGILCFALKDKINPAIVEGMANGTVTFKVSDFETNGIIHLEVMIDKAVAEGAYAEVFGVFCIVGAIAIVVLLFFFAQFAKIFDIIQASETPFSKEVLSKLKKAFIVFVVMMALLIDPGVAIFVGLSFWCVYNIMDYGTVLQTEVDETL